MADDPQDGGLASDGDLVAAAACGDGAAFGEIVRRHGGLVMGLALRELRNRAEAEDLVQDVFLRVHRGLPSFRGDASLKTWIAHVTVNAARNRRRSNRRQRLHLTTPLSEPQGQTGTSVADRLADRAPGPDRHALGREARERLDIALARLPRDFRQALLLRELEGLSYAEIATAVGARLGTVKSRIARARAQLQDALGDLVAPAARERP